MRHILKIFVNTLICTSFFASCVGVKDSGETSPPPPFPAQGIVQVTTGFQLDDYWVWDGSVVKGDDGLFHMFASRWPKNITFHPGWMLMSEVVHATADRVEGPYTFVDVVLPARGAEYWDGRATHNPTIRKHGDTYLLFYMGSTHPLENPEADVPLLLSDPRCIVARANKRIGLATSKSPYGPWTRSDQPVLETKPGTFYSFLTSNPAPVINDDGSVLLIFKSRRYIGSLRNPRHSGMMLGLARAKHYSGPYEVVGDEPIFGPDRFGEVEDPFVWKSQFGGYELIAKDMTGKLCGERHAAIHAYSPDGENWTLSTQPKSYSRVLRWDDGTTQNMGQLERPFVYLEDGYPRYLFCAAADGPGGFNNATKTWIVAIPLDKQGNN